MINYSNASPYYLTDQSNGYLGVITFRDLPYETDDILYEVTKGYENRPDKLAYDLYQNSELWWVFAVRNKTVIKDSVFDLKAGVRIYLPKLSTIKKVLGV